MEFVTVALVGLGLAMDALAVSVATGSVYRQMQVRHAVRMAVFFGAFQAGMPLVGYAVGTALRTTLAAVDHWVAFGLLGIVGAKMIYEAVQIERAEAGSAAGDPASLRVVLALSIATSLDALAVGVTLSLITEHVVAAAVLIGVITFGVSYLGCSLGRRLGHFFEKKIEVVGGLILIGIGLKILVEHLLSGR